MPKEDEHNNMLIQQLTVCMFTCTQAIKRRHQQGSTSNEAKRAQSAIDINESASDEDHSNDEQAKQKTSKKKKVQKELCGKFDT